MAPNQLKWHAAIGQPGLVKDAKSEGSETCVSVPVPAVDVFAGPGGLAEGFAPLGNRGDQCRFRLALSVEMDSAACRTLRLREFLRKFEFGPPDEYYEFLHEPGSDEPDWSVLYSKQWQEACSATQAWRLGTDHTTKLLRKRLQDIRNRHRGRTLLLGGPPCQSYSLVGRVRNAAKPGYDIDKDGRQSLYLAYADALAVLQPVVAVMENVKGMLSAQHNGERVFPTVLKALRDAGGRDQYRLYALAPSSSERWEPDDFLVRAEEHGVPQKRHRLIVICIRHDVAKSLPQNLEPRLEPTKAFVGVEDIIGAMPVLRSRLSRSDDGPSWQREILDAHARVQDSRPAMAREDESTFLQALDCVLASALGEALPFAQVPGGTTFPESCPGTLREWLTDPNLSLLPNNETRGHIPGDLARYLFATVFARTFGRSPKAGDYPASLAPDHANWNSGKFADRFRVQIADRPSTTVTSHISKDGHYFIHPDPRQCRSLTVREAARLQTFPDNYFFHGGRTQQYVQVGNAVPPYLARKIADQVAKVLEHHDRNVATKTRRTQQVQVRAAGGGRKAIAGSGTI